MTIPYRLPNSNLINIYIQISNLKLKWLYHIDYHLQTWIMFTYRLRILTLFDVYIQIFSFKLEWRLHTDCQLHFNNVYIQIANITLEGRLQADCLFQTWMMFSFFFFFFFFFLHITNFRLPGLFSYFFLNDVYKLQTCMMLTYRHFCNLEWRIHRDYQFQTWMTLTYRLPTPNLNDI